VDFFHLCCECIGLRLTDRAQYKVFQDTLPEFRCYTKVSKIKVSGTLYNAPPRFIQKLHEECLEEALQEAVRESHASIDQCRVLLHHELNVSLSKLLSCLTVCAPSS
jgi:hypothetical protein